MNQLSNFDLNNLSYLTHSVLPTNYLYCVYNNQNNPSSSTLNLCSSEHLNMQNILNDQVKRDIQLNTSLINVSFKKSKLL